jgi:DNA invertase Pin-like site-specific DNA recombinase
VTFRVLDRLKTSFGSAVNTRILAGSLFSKSTYMPMKPLRGVGVDRPGLGRLLAAALSPARPFDIILLDDSSRLARNTKDALTFFEQLNFAGIRLIAVSQGIDSDNEQSHVLVTVHGMVDSLYVKELAKKTHRGLEGLMLRDQHTGGHCFGYDSVSVPGTSGKHLVINESEAAVVRRIFEMSADGQSLKTIAKTLNRECVPPPRPRAGNQYGTWCHTCIREMLRRDLYIGKVIWNSSRFVKTPGTNKRVRRARPESEWRVVSHPELRVVSDELWQHVQERQKTLMATYGGAKSGGSPDTSFGHKPLSPQRHPEVRHVRRESNYCQRIRVLRPLSEVRLLSALQSRDQLECCYGEAELARRAAAGRVAESGSEARGHRVRSGRVRKPRQERVCQSLKPIGADA